MSMQKNYHVRAVHCDHLADDAGVYEALQRATAPLTQAWDKLKAARRIAIKFNQDWGSPPRKVEGQFREHVSEKVARALLRLLRENTTADLCAVDISWESAYNHAEYGKTTWLKPVFDEFDVAFMDGNTPPVVRRSPPGGGLMFANYWIPHSVDAADALVSVQKMKNHSYIGVTLCLKNLFGLMPIEPFGRHRSYYHHLVRMPYMLVDIGRIYNPALSVIDALVSQAGREWGSDEARITDTLVAGDQVVATDACGSVLMGHDPAADWLTEPYHRDRNPLLVAAEHGFGAVNLEEIDYQSEVQAPLGKFFAVMTDSYDRVINWRRTTAEQALFYRDNVQDFYGRYRGEYILLQRGEVRWHDPLGRIEVSRRQLAKEHPDDALWFKFVDPDEVEGENYEIYEQTLEQIKTIEKSRAQL